MTEEAQALPGVEVVIVPSLVREIRPLRDLWTVVALSRLLRRVRPSIVHTHSSKAGIVGRWAAWLAGVPIIIHTIHGYGITPTQPMWLRSLLIGMERLTSLVTTHWVAVAQADIEAGLRWGLFTRSRVSLVRPGIAADAFQAGISASERDLVRAELGAGPTDKLVGMVACLKPQKAPLDFIRVAELVCAERPSARFVLVGDGELRAPAERRIREAGLEDRVRLVGWRRDIPELMRCLDVFVLTSLWEGLPRVYLEARASGVPVVGTRVDGAVEVIQDGINGYLVEPGDVHGLADRVLYLLAHPVEAVNMGRNGRSLPVEFDIHEMVLQQEAEYERLLAGLAEKKSLSEKAGCGTPAKQTRE